MKLHSTQSAPAPRFIGLPDAMARTGLSKTTIWRLYRAGKFPSPITLPDSRRSVFVESEIDQWIVDRIAAARRGRA
ncbi:AlpA family phage regulatory protein [Aureimonas altamirensis]|uniref:helix-turn-helix transcriptional regulator n=1 Tax=Aureimonas altamirensis TaxID=370622 RepID=UPI001E381BBF|nr:AlpA family phage regulatory protein [Aureimonas altamirensis]UHD44149.1 AlpA family phage regulatory protein [Aureimonas altamirensis]